MVLGSKAQKRMTNYLGAIEYELNMVKDPLTGRIPEGIREQEMLQAKQILQRQLLAGRITENNYFFQGPDNLGGRTRALAYDVRYNGSTNQIILAGGVSGGIYKSTDNGATWTRKSPVGDHFSCTSLAQDTRSGSQDTWYYTTGEASGNSTGATGAFYSGNGVYKSTDNGETWSRLTNSNTSALESFSVAQDIINKVIVHPVSGDIYIACAATIRRSQDGGATWATVINGSLANTGQFTDITVTSTGRLYAAFGGTNANTVDGVWTSTTGNSGDWTRIAGTGVATDPAGWNAQNTYGRVVLALAPSNQNILYVLYWNGLAYPNIEAEFYKYDQSSGTWSDRSANLPDEAGGSDGNDPFAVQGGYDLVVAVKPDDENCVFIGGTNIYRSTDGFATNINYTRIGGYATPSAYGLYANSHPDIHAIVFQPGTPTTMLCGNDGGIQRTTNNLAGTVSWTPINTGYRTFQYYNVAVDPRSGNGKVLGGAQDNGTTRNIGGSGSNFEMVWGGDGVSAALSNDISGNTYEYVGSQLGQISRRNSTSGLQFGTNIKPTGLPSASGLFVTLFYLDPDNTQYLYYANAASVYRNTSASLATPSNWTNMTGIASSVGANNVTAFSTTRGTYNASTASLFIGTSNAKLYRLDDPLNSTDVTNPVNISAGLPATGYVSSISVNPRNDDTLLLTLSNYGVNSIWWTGNANSATPTWVNVERNLTLPSIRSSAITLSSATVEYFVGTSVGLYRTVNPNTTDWTQEGASAIGNAVVTSLAYRPSDNKLLIGTHGYGMWYTSLSNFALPVTLTDFKGTLLNKQTHLTWSTSSEQNSKNFEVEKSTDGVNYYKIGTVAAAGNSSSRRDYSSKDNQVNAINYYRLKMNDIDDRFKHSQVVVIRYNEASQALWVVNNPFSNHIDLRLAVKPRSVRLQLVSVNGSLVAEKTVTPAEQIRWDLQGRNISSGTYLLKAIVDGKSFTEKLVKQ
jgi:hypothetical protein